MNVAGTVTRLKLNTKRNGTTFNTSIGGITIDILTQNIVLLTINTVPKTVPKTCATRTSLINSVLVMQKAFHPMMINFIRIWHFRIMYSSRLYSMYCYHRVRNRLLSRSIIRDGTDWLMGSILTAGPNVALSDGNRPRWCPLYKYRFGTWSYLIRRFNIFRLACRIISSVTCTRSPAMMTPKM